MYDWPENHHAVNSREQHLQALLRLRCLLCNLPAIRSGPLLKPVRLPEETPAILCDAGASLVSHLDLLRELSDKALIIATARAALVMLQEGVVPRIVVATSPWADNQWSATVAQEQSSLFARPETDPELARHFPNILWMESVQEEVRQLSNRFELPLCPMKTEAVCDEDLLPSVALSLGCGRLALLGYDYCLDAYGRLYPEKERPENEPVLEIPGVDGRTVKTTHLLNARRLHFQEVLQRVRHAKGSTAVVNAARRGARLEGTVAQALSEFMADDSAFIARSPVLISEEGGASSRPEGVLLEELSRLRQVTASFMNHISRSVGGLTYLKQELQNMQGCGQVLLVEAALLLQQAADSLEEEDAEVMRRFACDLSGEIAADLELAMKRVFHTKGLVSSGDVHVFPSLKTLNTSLLGRKNPELAGWLQEAGPRDLTTDLELHWTAQTHPEIYLPEQGDLTPLTDLCDRAARAAQDVDRFVERNAFDLQKHGLVLFAPADWCHAAAWAAKYPEADVLVVEPWVVLLQAQLERADLLSGYAKDWLILALDTRLPSWTIRYSQRINQWRAESRYPLFFIPPALRKLKTVRAWYEMLTEKYG